MSIAKFKVSIQGAVCCGVLFSSSLAFAENASQRAVDLRSGTGLQEDSPASRQLEMVREQYRLGKEEKVSFPVYELVQKSSSLESLKFRASALGVPGDKLKTVSEDWKSEPGRVMLHAGEHLIVRNPKSGNERYANLERYHRGAGVAESEVLEKNSYVSRALDFVGKVFPGILKKNGLYAYKYWRYVNEFGKFFDRKMTKTVYQTAVALNSSIDGVPVIGSGCKVAVHMSVDGEIVGYEDTTRQTGAVRATVKGTEMLSPERAKAVAERRLESRGIDLAHFDLIREEFGYYCKSRNSVQSVISPYYAYFFQPKTKHGSKVLLELVPASTNLKIKKMIAEDNALDAARKKYELRNKGTLDRK